jgi:hypothetical protein
MHSLSAMSDLVIPGQVFSEARVAAAGPGEPGAGRWVDLLVHRLVGCTPHDLAGGEAEGLCSWSPTTGRVVPRPRPR